MRIGLYAHGGSGNHGCEALARSTVGFLGEHECVLFSERPKDDVRYGLDSLATIVPSQKDLPKGLGYFAYALEMKRKREDSVFWRWRYRGFERKIRNLDLALAIGGDNYCYSGYPERFSVLNRKLVQKKIPIVLWGCSIDKERLSPMMLEDLRLYNLIVARESITYHTLKDAGLDHVAFMPDPAFLLEAKEAALPQGFLPGKMVGLNVSPLIIRQEPDPGCVLRNCRQLINHILQQTDMGVVLIPHVVWSDNDDRIPLAKLYEEYASSGRVLMIDDNDAPAIKGIIRHCRFLVAARTHASIAGYSTKVPTVVMGYSVKSRGIAKDIFGSADHYVLPIDRMAGEDELTEAFKWLIANEDSVRKLYESRLMDYLSGLNSSVLNGLL
jgi:polysaccharide pyruvyl transferase WcaK-like protein